MGIFPLFRRRRRREHRLVINPLGQDGLDELIRASQWFFALRFVRKSLIDGVCVYHGLIDLEFGFSAQTFFTNRYASAKKRRRGKHRGH